MHERYDINVHEQSAMGLDSRAVSDRVPKQIVTILYFIVHNMYNYKQYLTQQITKTNVRTCIHTYKTITTILGKMIILSVKAQFREVEARGRILFLSSSSS